MVLLATLFALQAPPADLLRDARAALDAGQLDSASVLLAAARGAATTTQERIEGLFWTSLMHFMAGRDSLSRAYARNLFELSLSVDISGVKEVSKEFLALLNHERETVEVRTVVFTPSAVAKQPVRLSGPQVVYPPGPWRRQAKGRVLIQGVVDTAGRLEAPGLEILEVPDSELVEPVRKAVLGYTFSPGRLESGRAARTLTRLGIMLQPGPAPNPTDLVRAARAQITAGKTDSAHALLDFAEDSLVRATPGVRAYAKLVRGLALRAQGRDSLAAIAFDAGLGGVAELTRQGVDLAPFLRQLADSVRRARRPTATPTGAPVAVEPVDAQPSIITAPPLEYPPEMRTLGVGGTVIVEQAVDSSGRPVPGTARVVQTPNPGLNAASLKVATGASYRPAMRGGKPVRVVIRQPVTFFQ